MKKIIIYTDGACSKNPGPGGWGAVLIYKDIVKELSGAVSDTTNNQMELMAAIMAFKALKEPCEVEIFTDSNYVKDGITKWLHSWKKNNWKTSNNKPVKNIELWQQLEEVIKDHNISWQWVKGHAGDHWNEVADSLARNAINKDI